MRKWGKAMKMYLAQDGVRLVGKAWEVRRQLKEMCRPAAEKTLLTQLVSERTAAGKHERNR